MKEERGLLSNQGLLSPTKILSISLLPNKLAGKKPMTRYTCRSCPLGCDLVVHGKIIRIRQICPQFKNMDDYSLWTEQVPK
jgi:hypothetical protein